MAKDPNLKQLLKDTTSKLKKAIEHLEWSFKKIKNLPTDLSKMDDEQLEVWESFSARFSRVIDLYLARYLRTRVLDNDPGYQGSLRDFVDQAEKLGVIENADFWMEMRALRNITNHEYKNEDLQIFFDQLKKGSA